MKKIIALLLATFMLLSLCACGNGQGSVEGVEKADLRIDLKGVTDTLTVKSSTGESEDLIEYLNDEYDQTEHPLTNFYHHVPGAFSYEAWNCVYELKEQPLDTEYTFTYDGGGTMFLMNENFYYTFYSIPSSLKIDLNGTMTSDGFNIQVAKLRSEDVTDIEYLFALSAQGSYTQEDHNITFKKIADNVYELSSDKPIEHLEIRPERSSKFTVSEKKTSYKITLDEYKEVTVE